MRSTKWIALLLCLSLLACLLLGCGDKKDDEKKAEDPAIGTWKGEYTQIVGDGTGSEPKSEDEVFSLDLQKDGKGVHHRDGLDIDVTWKLDGENFSMTETFMGMTIEYTGTMKDGKLSIFNGDPEDMWTYLYVYNKQ